MRHLLPVLFVLLTACSIPVRQGRLDPLAAPLPEEQAAAERLASSKCGPGMSLLWPGLGQLCDGRTAEGASMASVAVAEVGATAALWGKGAEDGSLFEDNGSTVPLVALQDVYTYSYADALLDRHRAGRLLYTPLDTSAELLAAPFNRQVLREPYVWGGVLGLTAGATALTLLLDEPPPRRPDYVDLFGAELDPALGYPLVGITGAALFEHVALAEEAAFRGLVQSSLARAFKNEWAGWAVGSLIFGGFHAFNAVMLPPDEARQYLLTSVPYITLTGAWLGYSYMKGGYSLTHPVAIHFWYDLALTGVQVVRSPGRHMFSMELSFPI